MAPETRSGGVGTLHRTKNSISVPRSRMQHETDEKLSEPSNVHRRGSLLPKRSTSTTQIDLPVNQPEALAGRPARIPSPTKLPQGPLQRSSSLKPPMTEEGFPSHKGRSHQRAPSKTLQLKKPLHSTLEKPATDALRSKPRDLPTTIDRMNHVPGSQMRTREVEPPQDSKSQHDKPSMKLAYTQLPDKATRTPANAAAKLQRPTFSALQQHYSPKKTDSIVSGKAQETATPRLQSPQYNRETLESKLELLHLHMMHRDSAVVQQQWQDSAEESYKRQFMDLAALDSNLDNREVEHLEQLNATAILAWCNGSEEATIERKMRILSTIVEEAWSISRPSGKCTLVIQAFEHWYARASEVHSQRTGKDNISNDHIHILEGLGDGWKAEVVSLHGQILQTADSLLRLGEVEHQSDLARCITVLSEMLKNMLEELEMVQLIESQIVQQEKVWVESSINKIASGLRDEPSTNTARTGRRR